MIKEIVPLEDFVTVVTGHSLNLAMCDTIKKCKIARDALDTAYEISKLIKFSPKCNHMFEELKQQFSPGNPGFRVLDG